MTAAGSAEQVLAEIVVRGMLVRAEMVNGLGVSHGGTAYRTRPWPLPQQATS